ncbi:ParB-like nuclease domain-containing protein [Rhizobiales bacterium GAS188]|nr:ParB-like nuclease domain-containing protein [Rhizobiales bacterium GAS188]
MSSKFEFFPLDDDGSEYPPHPLANDYREMDPAEFRGLANDIVRNGLLHPIIIHKGRVLDGRHRLKACREAGVKPRLVEYRGDRPRDVVEAHDLNRRHLYPDDKRTKLEAALARNPERSNRQIAADIGVSDKTVGAARGRLEDVRSIPHVSTVKDTLGRRQPARKPAAMPKAGRSLFVGPKLSPPAAPIVAATRAPKFGDDAIVRPIRVYVSLLRQDGPAMRDRLDELARTDAELRADIEFMRDWLS